MNEPTTTIVGNLTADPELRYTQSGTPVSNFSVAVTPRLLNRDSGEWEDGDTLFMRATAWGELGEHFAQLGKGDRVIVTGKLEQNNYQDRDGNNRSSIELTVDDGGPSLRWATATVSRAASGQSDEPPAAPAGRGRGQSQTRGRSGSRR